MGILTNIDGNTHIKGDEIIEIRVNGNSAGCPVYCTMDGSEPAWDISGNPVETDVTQTFKYTGPFPVGIKGIGMDDQGFTHHDTIYMALKCKSAEYNPAMLEFVEKETRELILKFIYLPESEPRCFEVQNNHQEYSLINKWVEGKADFNIMFREDGDNTWLRWPMIPGTEDPEKMKVQVNEKGIYVHIIQAKLQHKNYPLNDMESLTRTFAYVVKP